MNYIFVRKFNNVGHRRIASEISTEFETLVQREQPQCIGDMQQEVAESLRCWMIEQAEEFQLVNFKVVCNENNNDSQDLPLNVDVIYRRKNSHGPTTMGYTIKERPPEDEPDHDRFARWRK